MIDVSHFVVNGCSYTYGTGLNNPKIHSWPAIVSDRFSVPVVNLARPGIGNEAIHRRTHEYFYEDIKNQNHPFYIICFSAITRKEHWVENMRIYDGIHIPFDSSYEKLSPAQKDYMDNYNLEDFYRRTLIIKTSLSNLFSANRIPYIFLNLLHLGKIEYQIEDKLKTKFPNFIESVKNNVYDFKTQSEIVGMDYKKTECGHYDEETNMKIGNFVTDKINDIFKINIVKDKKYLSLKEYTEIIEPYYMHDDHKKEFGEWL